MPYQSSNPRRRKRKQQNTSSPIVLLLVGFLFILIGLAVVLRVVSGGPAKPAAPTEPAPTQIVAEKETKEEKPSLWSRLFGKKEKENQEDPPEETEPVQQEVTATILATGDILMHKQVFNSGLQSDGRYDLNYIFQYIRPYVEAADYAVANLETTLCGTNNGYAYSGFPNFNCPDEIVDALKNAGFDCLLTANNHCFDTGEVGFMRTIETVRSKGLDNLGTMKTPDETKYLLKDINGIKVGMLCYTYEQPPESGGLEGRVYLNNIPMMDNGEDYINSFLPADPEPFYREIDRYLKEMRSAGAEATVVFIHWGNEYQTTPSGDQRILAQKLADMGVDVIVGGHPHVVQQVDTLSSRLEPDHKTFCLYSMGNAVSNQRISEMNLKTGHTEDGVLFSFTFRKFADGTVAVDSIELIPTWVDLRSEDKTEYCIIPMEFDRMGQWQSDYQMNGTAFNNALSSYERTMELVEGGLTRAQDYLTRQREERSSDSPT